MDLISTLPCLRYTTKSTPRARDLQSDPKLNYSPWNSIIDLHKSAASFDGTIHAKWPFRSMETAESHLCGSEEQHRSRQDAMLEEDDIQ